MNNSAIRSRLIADGSVSALVGPRVFLEQLEQECDMPAILMELVDANPLNTIGAETTLKNEVWNIECWAKTHSSANALAVAAEAALIASGTDFTAIKTATDIFFDDQTNLRGVSLEFSVWI